MLESAPAADNLWVPAVARLPELSTTNLLEPDTCSWRRLPPAVSLMKTDGLDESSVSALDGASETKPSAPPEPCVQDANWLEALRQT